MESAVVGAFLKSVLGSLIPLLEKEYNKHRGLQQETESIKLELAMIAAAMDDKLRGLGRYERTATARLYSEEILDLAHDIEDCVDRFKHRLRCKPAGGGGGGAASSLKHRVAHELKKVQSRFSYAGEIQKLRTRMEKARQRVVNSVTVAQSGQPNGLPAVVDSSKPCPVTPNPVGFEKPMEEVLSLLHEVDDEAEKLRVISIVGFGGSGKTTLARAVYDSRHAKETFPCRAWVSATAGTPPEMIRERINAILRDILHQVDPQGSMDVATNNPEASLKEYLSDKRYLIVIDDVQMDEWKTVNSAFAESSTRSRIILTTTIKSVANKCSHDNGYVYQMDTLGQEDSKKIALLGIRSPELEHGSSALLGKCDGLPLALVSISDYLKSSSEPTGKLCAKLCRNLGSHLNEEHGNDNFSDLRRVLLHNYDSMSGYALSRFLYLGVFPKNRPLKRKVVTRRWLAEGYARSESFDGEEDIADAYFDKLIDWNIIRPIDTRNNSQVKTFKTHGIMHEFILHKSSQGFIMMLPPDHPEIRAKADNARHLSVHDGKLAECVAFDEDLSRVRSLTVFGAAGGARSYIRKCRLIRVLDLEECNDLDDNDLEHICKLWHLKYLSLGGAIPLLPRCIDGLHCLETLDLRRTKIESLPIEAIQLPHLIHLFGKLTLAKDDLKNVDKRRKLEKFLSRKKSNLQTLAGVVSDDSKVFLQLITGMLKLRKVKIWCKHVANSSSYISDLSKAIEKLTKIPMELDGPKDCSLSLDSEEPSENLLSSLNLEPCSEGSKYHLWSLKIHGKLPRLPPLVTLFSGLAELCISFATLTMDLLSPLANLRDLLYLKLITDLLEHFEIKHGAFPSLRRLCFQVQRLASGLPTIEKGALPYLVSLQLLCRGLVGLSGINIRHFDHLKELTIYAETTSQTRQDWKDAARNHPNRPRVVLLENEELGLDSSPNTMGPSESSSWTQATVHPAMGAATMTPSSIPIPLHVDASVSWMPQTSHP